MDLGGHTRKWSWPTLRHHSTVRHEKNQQNPVKDFGLRAEIRIPDSVKRLEPRTVGT